MDFDLCDSPVFVIGSPRSGTTALAWALAEHEDFWTSSESQILVDLFGRGSLDKNYAREGDGSWLRKYGIERDDFLRNVGLGFNALFTGLSEGRRWVDHTPAHTTMVNDLAALFPSAKFLHILRDGRRVAHSMIHYADRFGGYAPGAPWSANFREACRTWVRFTDIAMEFQDAFPEHCLTIRNETLVENPAGGFVEILEFLGAAPDPAVAEFFGAKRINSSFGPPGKNVGAVDTLTTPWAEWGLSRKHAFIEEASEAMVRYGLADASEFSLSAWEHEILTARRALHDTVEEAASILIAGAHDDLQTATGAEAWEVTPLPVVSAVPRRADLTRAATEGVEFAVLLGPVLREIGGLDVARRTVAEGLTVLHAGDEALIVRLR